MASVGWRAFPARDVASINKTKQHPQMKTVQQLLNSALAVGTLLLAFVISSATAAETIPQVQPVITLLKAVKESDQKQLKSAFSEKMRAQFDQEGWDKVLLRYQEGFKTAFGDYKLADFAFIFKGGEENGGVTVVHNGKMHLGMAVTKERDEWKLKER
jgi:hypothetical protein